MTDDYQRRLVRLQRQVQAASATTRTANGRASAANGAVIVQVGASGTLEDLRIEPSAMQMDPRVASPKQSKTAIGAPQQMPDKLPNPHSAVWPPPPSVRICKPSSVSSSANRTQ